VAGPPALCQTWAPWEMASVTIDGAVTSDLDAGESKTLN
jgi:hypothetical protein